MPLRNQQLLIGTVAPRRDFLVGTRWDAATIGAMIVMVLVLAFLVGRRVSRRFAAGVDSLIAESERIGALQLDAPVQIAWGTREIGKLVSAQESMRVMLLEATRNLETKVEVRTHELNETLEQQRAIFESATSGIALIKDRHIQHCNRRLEEIFGYAPGEFVGQPTRRCVHLSDADYAAAGDNVRAQLARGGTHFRELQLARKDGSVFWGRFTGRAVDPADVAKGSVWILEDVTEERAAADVLREANERLDLAQEAGNVGVFDVVIGGRNFWTPQLERMFGLRNLGTRFDGTSQGSHLGR